MNWIREYKTANGKVIKILIKDVPDNVDLSKESIGSIRYRKANDNEIVKYEITYDEHIKFLKERYT